MMSEKRQRREDAIIKAQKLFIETGHPVQILKLENQRIREVVAGLRNRKETDLQASRQALDVVRKHYLKKQDLIYPVLEASYGISGPSRVLWAEDDKIRGKIRALSSEAVLTEILDAAEAMADKEDRVLIPLCVQFFTEEDWVAVYRDLPNYPYACGISYPAWASGEAGLAETGTGRPVGLSPDAENPMEEVKLSGGHMSLRHLNAIMKMIPVEMTFVDETDTNRFFSGGGAGFRRSLSALDRNVMTCHPPKALTAVEKVIASFRSGEKDKVEYWLEKGGTYLLIRYIAVRDDDGSYLGTLECVQDLTFAKTHFEKRRQV